MADKTKIDWCDMSWNPITGCMHGCEYCYARRVATRFDGGYGERGENHVLHAPLQDRWRDDDSGEMVEGRKEPYPYGFDPTFHRYRLEEVARKQRGRNIFVGSMADVFGSWVPMEWIVAVFNACKAAPQHNYLFLTKNPARYAELDDLGLLPRESNFWYGTSVTTGKQAEKAADAIGQLSSRVKTFFSMEPLLEDVATTSGWEYTDRGRYANWIIIGAATGPGKERLRPRREWVQRIVDDAWKHGIPVFMKENLASVWGEDLIREFPPELTPGRGDRA